MFRHRRRHFDHLPSNELERPVAEIGRHELLGRQQLRSATSVAMLATPEVVLNLESGSRDLQTAPAIASSWTTERFCSLARYSRPFLTLTWSHGRTSSIGRLALAVERRRRCRGRRRSATRARASKYSRQASSRAPRRQASSSAGGDAAVAAGQDAFEQAALDVVALDRHRADPAPATAGSCAAQWKYSRVCIPFHW